MNQINHFGIFTKLNSVNNESNKFRIFTKLNSVNNESNKPFQNIYQTKQCKQ